MFDGIKIFTIRMIAGANVASVILMMAVGYSDHLSPEHFALLSTTGLFFPLFLFVNFCFLASDLVVQARYALIPFLGFLLCYVPVRKYMPLNICSEPPAGSIKVLYIGRASRGERVKISEGVNSIEKNVRRQK